MTFATFVQPGQYVRSDGVRVCGHKIPVGPGACADCHSLTDDHWDTRCTCVADLYDAPQAGGAS